VALDVELFVSEIGDQFMVFHAQRSYYEQLLRAGVKIYLYRAPTILHAKHVSIDDDVAVIGSSNLDIRSLSLHMELSVLIHGARFTDAMRAIEDDYRSKSRQVLLEDWLRRPTRERIFDKFDAADVLPAMTSASTRAPDQSCAPAVRQRPAWLRFDLGHKINSGLRH
jgi:phosphatidylserine/phosphatidylglycerophosphate/cardiolipin synthase-like enzyme